MMTKEFRVGDLFVVKSNPQLNKDSFKFSEDAEYPYFTRTVLNNGIAGYVHYLDDEHMIQGNSIAVGMLGMKFFYMTKPFYAGQFTKTVFPKFEGMTERIALYFVVHFNKMSEYLLGGLVRDFERLFTEAVIKLPVTDNGKIDFQYMEKRISELEAERISELEAYLKITDLDDFVLSDIDKYVLNKDVKYKKFKIEDVLQWQSQKEIAPLKIPELSVDSDIKYPFYGQATSNNGIISYESLQSNVLNNPDGKPTLLIHSNNQNIVYLETPFYLKDGHGATSVLQSDLLNEKVAMYMISCIRRVITKKFTYNEKATKVALKNTYIKLPVTDAGSIDYDYMEKYIRAIEKRTIAKVYKGRGKVIDTTHKIVSEMS